MNGIEEHNALMEWLLKDAARSGDVDYANKLVNAIGRFHLQQSNPALSQMLSTTMDEAMKVQELRNSPKQIGQLVAKQDNNYMMGERMMEMITLFMNQKKD